MREIFFKSLAEIEAERLVRDLILSFKEVSFLVKALSSNIFCSSGLGHFLLLLSFYIP